MRTLDSRLRQCLGIDDNGHHCNQMFRSEGPWHRMCETCRERIEDAGFAAQVYGSPPTPLSELEIVEVVRGGGDRHEDT